MASPVIGSRPRYVPPKGAFVDRTHSLASGLEFCFVPSYGPVDLAKGYAGTIGGTPSARPNAFGNAGRIASASSDYYSFEVADTAFLGPISILWVGRIDAANVLHDVGGWKTATNGGINMPFGAYTYGATSPMGVNFARADAAGNKSWSRDAFLPINTDGVFLVSAPTNINVTSPVFYFNGANVGTLTAGGSMISGVPTGSNAPIRVGRRADGSVQLDGSLNIYAIWSRQLNAADAAALSANPFCFLRY